MACPGRMFLCALTSFAGIEYLDNLHRNIRTLAGTSVFHKVFHDFSSWWVFEDPDEPSSHASHLCCVDTSIRYADLTEKLPLFS